MKFLMVLVLGVNFTLVNAKVNKGGVDVGNSSPAKLLQYYISDFTSEKDLIDYTQSIKDKLEKLDHPKIKTWVAQGKCTTKKAKLKQINVNEYYRYDNKKKAFVQKYHGKIILKLDNCKTPAKIIDDSGTDL